MPEKIKGTLDRFITAPLMSSVADVDTIRGEFAEADLRRWRAQILPMGRFAQNDGLPDDEPGDLVIDEEFLQTLVDWFRETDHRVYMTWDHRWDADPRNAWGVVVDLALVDDGLDAIFETSDATALEKLESGLAEFSVGIDMVKNEKTGEIDGPLLIHVAMVTSPYFRGMRPAEEVTEDEPAEVEATRAAALAEFARGARVFSRVAAQEEEGDDQVEGDLLSGTSPATVYEKLPSTVTISDEAKNGVFVISSAVEGDAGPRGGVPPLALVFRGETISPQECLDRLIAAHDSLERITAALTPAGLPAGDLVPAVEMFAGDLVEMRASLEEREIAAAEALLDRLEEEGRIHPQWRKHARRGPEMLAFAREDPAGLEALYADRVWKGEQRLADAGEGDEGTKDHSPQKETARIVGAVTGKPKHRDKEE